MQRWGHLNGCLFQAVWHMRTPQAPQISSPHPCLPMGNRKGSLFICILLEQFKGFLGSYSYLPQAAAVSGSVKGCKMNPVKYGCKNPPKPQFITWFLGHGFRTYFSFSSDGLKEREKTNASRFVLDALCSLIRKKSFINAGPRRRINSIILLFALTKNTQTLQLLTACSNSALIFQAAITV